jgi:hypothetical protein
MYIREIEPPRASPFESGKPIPGTWTGAFEEVDLLEIQQPFSIPFPRWIREYRIKEWESFIIQDERFYLGAYLFNLKYYRGAQVVVYDKNSRERMWFRKIIPLGGWRLPRTLANASIDSRSYSFFFRIHDWLDADIIKVDFDIEATRKRPSFTAHVEFNLSRSVVTPMAVNLLFSDRRSMYALKALTEVRGDMVFGGRHIVLDPRKTSGIFCDVKGYFPYRMRPVWCTGCGFDAENRRYGFSIAESQTRESYKNNENALWLDGRLTPLPPVRITMPNGVDSDWVIQDMEGMVDLTFSPQERSRSALNLLVSRVEYDTPMGLFNGMLFTSEGERIPVRNLWGLGEKLYLRV